MIYTMYGAGYLWTETVLMVTLSFVAGLLIQMAIREHYRKVYDTWRYQLPDKLFVQENELNRDFSNYKKWRM